MSELKTEGDSLVNLHAVDGPLGSPGDFLDSSLAVAPSAPTGREICQHYCKVHYRSSYPVIVMASVSHQSISRRKKKKKKGKTLPTRSHINTQVRAHTGRTLHLDTKHLSGAVGTCRLPVCFSLQRLMLLTSERGGA